MMRKMGTAVISVTTHLHLQLLTVLRDLLKRIGKCVSRGRQLAIAKSAVQNCHFTSQG